MSNGGPGKKRSPGIDILLFVVTLGVYWFVWNYKAFTEFGEHRGKDLKAGTWIPILAVLWVVTIAVFTYSVATAPEVAADAGIEESFQTNLDDYLRPAVLAGTILSVLYYVLQLVYHKPATEAVQEAAKEHALTKSANPTLAVLFNVFFAAGQAIPIVGGLLGLAAVIIAIVWVVQVQNVLNEYWDRAAYQYPAQQPTYGAAPRAQSAGGSYAQPTGGQPQPPQSGSPSQPQQPPAQGAPPAPGQQPAAPTHEKTFACPNCRTHVTVNYTPGTPTPVQCHQCGQRGNIK